VSCFRQRDPENLLEIECNYNSGTFLTIVFPFAGYCFEIIRSDFVAAHFPFKQDCRNDKYDNSISGYPRKVWQD